VSLMTTHVANILHLISVTERSRLAGISFIKELLFNKMDFSGHVFLLYFRVPKRMSRSAALFLIPHSTANCMLKEQIRWLMSPVHVHNYFLKSIFETIVIFSRVYCFITLIFVLCKN